MRKRARLGLGAALLCLALAAPTTGAAIGDTTGNAPPVTADDEVTLLAGTTRSVPVLANDTDDARDLALCRVRGTDQVGAETSRRRVEVVAGADTGSFQVAYQACDYSYLVPAQVAVHVAPVRPVRVHKVADRPGVLEVSNANAVEVLVGWGAPPLDRLDGRVRVAPRSHVRIKVHRERIIWLAVAPYDRSESGLLAYGRVKDIALPNGTATPSGVPGGRSARLWRHRGVSTRTLTAPTGASSDWPDDPTGVPAPTTSPDTLRWWSGSNGYVPVVANDSDPQGQPLELCRLGPGAEFGPSSALFSANLLDGALYVSVDDNAEGTATVRYFACNNARLASGTLRVIARRAIDLIVRVVPARPGVLRVRNLNGVRVQFEATHGEGGRLRGFVAPHDVRYFHVRWRALEWQGLVGPRGGSAGHGSLVGIPQPS